MNAPLVSIIIPVYNREKIVCNAIDSALRQTYQNIEVVITDNASTDKTWNVLNEYAKCDKRIKIFKNSENVGPVKNWKECISHSKGKYIKILWSDDAISNDFLEKTVPVMEENENCGFVYSKVRVNYGCKSKIEHKWGRSSLYDTRIFVKSSLLNLKSTPVSPGCALFRREDVVNNLIIEIPNNLNLDFPKYGAGNDLLLFLLPCLNYNKFYYVDEALSIFNGGNDSITVTNSKDLEVYYSYAKYYFVTNFGGGKFRNMYYSRLKFGNHKDWVEDKEFKIDILAILLVICRILKNRIVAIIDR